MLLKELRKRQGLTQQEMADALNMSRENYNRYETGKRSPSLEVLIEIADHFSVSLDYLVGRTSTEGEACVRKIPEPIAEAQAVIPETDLTSPEKIKAYIDALVEESVNKAIDRKLQK